MKKAKLKQSNEMTKSSVLSLKFSNAGKLAQLDDFLTEYLKVAQVFVDLLWPLEVVPSLIPKALTDQVSGQTWLSARAIQAAAKQASGIVRGTKEKNRKRNYVYEKLFKEGHFKQARKLAATIKANPMTKPLLKTIQPQLDSRFVNLNFDSKTKFDGWISLASLGQKLYLELPFKKTKHFNRLVNQGWTPNVKSARLSNKSICLTFTKEPTKARESGITLGIDVGVRSTYSASDGQQARADIHGWDLDGIQKRFKGKVKGSKAFGKVQEHRTNHINWVINQLNLDGVKTVKMENIKNLRKGKKSSGYLSRWTYTKIFDKLEDVCANSGVLTAHISPTYTSQRCSVCGWTRKRNRKGRNFKCTTCGFTADADLNASKNISLDLPEISREERLKQNNRLGFYWKTLEQEPIVPAVQKAQMEEISLL
jgi:IS605 OrfB family transposase